MRLDTWLFPFLNVYGIGGKTCKTTVDVGITARFPLEVSTDLTDWYVGYGAMINGKIGPIFLSVDGNQTHNHNPNLNKPVIVSIGSFRTGGLLVSLNTTNGSNVMGKSNV